MLKVITQWVCQLHLSHLAFKLLKSDDDEEEVEEQYSFTGSNAINVLTLSTLKLDAVNPFANVILVSEFIAVKTKLLIVSARL